MPQKVPQSQPPFQYLGHILYPKEINPQKMKNRKDNIQILNDFQKLLGDDPI